MFVVAWRTSDQLLVVVRQCRGVDNFAPNSGIGLFGYFGLEIEERLSIFLSTTHFLDYRILFNVVNKLSK